MKRGEFDYAYNAQAGTDEGHGIIVVAGLSNEASDTGHLPEAVEEVRELRQELGKTEEEATEKTEDRGYFSVENIRQEGKGIELLIASGREDKDDGPNEKDRVYSVEKFTYAKTIDLWRCPEGRLLEREKRNGGKGRPKLRRYICSDCNGCRLKSHCLKPGAERKLLVKRKQMIRADMRARLKDPVKQAIYRKRKWVAEQVIGQIKEGLGFRGFTVRGESFGLAQWLFVCAVRNVMKAVRFITGFRKMKEMAAQAAAA